MATRAPNKDERHELDFYETDNEVVQALLHDYPIPHRARTLDPGCGRGNILAALSRDPNAYELNGVEIDPDRFEYTAKRIPTANVFCDNFNLWALDYGATKARFDYIAGNPPYVLAEAFTRSALPLLSERGILAYLFPITFMNHRIALHAKFPCAVHPLHPRPSFTEDGGTDATEYAWFVWGRGIKRTWCPMVWGRGISQI